jgi:Ca2+-binding EF-hand superfamily protein
LLAFEGQRCSFTFAEDAKTTHTKKIIVEFLIAKNMYLHAFLAPLQRSNTDWVSPSEFASLFQQIQELSSEEVATLYASLDIDGNKKVTLGEITAHLAAVDAKVLLRNLKAHQKEMPKLFAQYGSGSEKSVRVEGFAQIMGLLLKDVRPEQSNNLFRLVDQNSNGFVSLKDFTALDLGQVV